jgi:hypothetical protein
MNNCYGYDSAQSGEKRSIDQVSPSEEYKVNIKKYTNKLAKIFLDIG